MSLRIGSLFSGYGGLDLGVQAALGGEVVWHSEINPDAARILAHHWPDVPNLGDITKVNWADVPPVDVLTGGFPCQDVSTAGARAGLAGARSGLWSVMAEAIQHLHPRLVVIENVEGLLSANAASNMEPCPWCLGDAGDEPAMRALGAVLADLAGLGFDAEWGRISAASVGAPHRRNRVFIVAWPTTDTASLRRERREDLSREGWGEGVGRETVSLTGYGTAPHVTLLPTPAAHDSGNTPEEHLRKKPGRTVVTSLQVLVDGGLLATGGRLLPTPEAKLGSSGPDYARASRDGSGGDDLATQIARLLPTPRGTDGTKGGPNQRGSKGDLMLPSAVVQLLPTPTTQADKPQTRESYGPNLGEAVRGDRGADFGDYAPAIRRWEHVLGRPAPPPTEPGTRGNPRLSPAFVEWMQGLPAGHVTSTSIPRSAQLTALGNGVVPQQAAAAIRALLTRRAPAPPGAHP